MAFSSALAGKVHVPLGSQTQPWAQQGQPGCASWCCTPQAQGRSQENTFRFQPLMEDPASSSIGDNVVPQEVPGDVVKGESFEDKETANSHLGFPTVSISFTASPTPASSLVSGLWDFFLRPAHTSWSHPASGLSLTFPSSAI